MLLLLLLLLLSLLLLSSLLLAVLVLVLALVLLDPFVVRPAASMLLLLLLTSAALLLVLPLLQGGSVLGACLSMLLVETGTSDCSCRKAYPIRLLSTILRYAERRSAFDGCLQGLAQDVAGQIKQQHKKCSHLLVLVLNDRPQCRDPQTSGFSTN
jgi:hypothetical protein